MKKEINTKVVKEFERYCQIRIKDKKLCKDSIPLYTKKSHPSNQQGNSFIQFIDGSENADLIIEVNADNTKSFRFRLLCDTFMKEPCYRFESDGGTHRNPSEEGITLKQRQIPTPHFHRYNEKGENIAYKTDALISTESDLLNDFNKALRHFCQEENIEISAETIIRLETLPLGTCEYPDPLEGVEFK